MELNLKDSLHMNIGEGENSYIKNSLCLQKIVASTLTTFEKAVKSLFDHDLFFNKLLNVADLGCSTGPNTFLTMSTVLRTILEKCQELNLQIIPEIKFQLSDLPSNDFNTLFKGVQEFCAKLEKKDYEFPSFYCSGVPGSFHDRLFPSNTLHLVHSSYAVHWLSKLPKFVSDQGLPLNKGNIYISNTTPTSVKKTYFSHFEKDFSSFLKCRSEEMVTNGLMFLTLEGRESEDPASCKSSTYRTDVLSKALAALVLEGLIDEKKIDEFNMPLYAASREEVGEVVEKEGSFAVEHLETLEVGTGDMWSSAQDMIKNFRVYTESVLAMQFGEEVMDKLYDKAVEIVALDWEWEACPMTKVISNVVLLRKI